MFDYNWEGSVIMDQLKELFAVENLDQLFKIIINEIKDVAVKQLLNEEKKKLVDQKALDFAKSQLDNVNFVIPGLDWKDLVMDILDHIIPFLVQKIYELLKQEALKELK